jgi:hypothetical protein
MILGQQFAAPYILKFNLPYLQATTSRAFISFIGFITIWSYLLWSEANSNLILLCWSRVWSENSNNAMLILSSSSLSTFCIHVNQAIPHKVITITTTSNWSVHKHTCPFQAQQCWHMHWALPQNIRVWLHTFLLHLSNHFSAYCLVPTIHMFQYHGSRS